MTKDELIKNQFPNDEFLQSSVLQIVDKCVAELELKIKHITRHLEPQVMTALFEQVEEEVKQEQRIEELEKKIKKNQDDIDCSTLACENYREEMEKNLADAAELEKENAELKERNRELLESCEGATMMYKDLCKAKEIIKKLKTLYLYPVVTKDDVKRQDEILAEAEQFLNSEVEK